MSGKVVEQYDACDKLVRDSDKGGVIAPNLTQLGTQFKLESCVEIDGAGTARTDIPKDQLENNKLVKQGNEILFDAPNNNVQDVMNDAYQWTGSTKNKTGDKAYATNLKLDVHAGHGLTYKSAKIISRIKKIKEFNIGHFLIGESIYVGLPTVIKNFQKILK